MEPTFSSFRILTGLHRGYTTSVRKTYFQGECIFKEGEPGDNAYIIVKGEVELFVLINGETKLISRLSQGSIFGEMALIDDGLRSATAVASSILEVIIITRKHFDEKVSCIDPFVNTLLKVILKRYREMRERLEHAVTTPNSEEFLVASESSQSLQQATYLTACQVEAEDELKHALAENQFELFYQPIVDLVQCRIIGAEALIRWRHPERGLIPPLEFIPIAEQSDIIIALGLWLIEDACRSYKMFQKILPDQLNFISINLSSRQFTPPDLAENIKLIFERSRINGEHIKFEITESILMADPINTINTLNEIKKLGASIAIDDFGTGYSSFSYLHRFPIDTLKIDKSFISTMLDNPKSFEIVKSLCVLAKSLGLNIVAEGIESNREHHILKGMSSDYGQGYYYSKPVAAHEFIELLKIKKFEC